MLRSGTPSAKHCTAARFPDEPPLPCCSIAADASADAPVSPFCFFLRSRSARAWPRYPRLLKGCLSDTQAGVQAWLKWPGKARLLAYAQGHPGYERRGKSQVANKAASKGCSVAAPAGAVPHKLVHEPGAADLHVQPARSAGRHAAGRGGTTLVNSTCLCPCALYGLQSLLLVRARAARRAAGLLFDCTHYGILKACRQPFLRHQARCKGARSLAELLARRTVCASGHTPSEAISQAMAVQGKVQHDVRELCLCHALHRRMPERALAGAVLSCF